MSKRPLARPDCDRQDDCPLLVQVLEELRELRETQKRMAEQQELLRVSLITQAKISATVVDRLSSIEDKVGEILLRLPARRIRK